MFSHIMRLLKKFAPIVKPLDWDVLFCLACWRGSVDILIGVSAAAQNVTTPETYIVIALLFDALFIFENSN